MNYQFTEITPENTIFVLLSFEGPDRYSLAGGLGVRVSELSDALAQAGFESHLFFVGAPHAPQQEVNAAGTHLWRCCQELSRHYSAGVYQGEDEKIKEFERTVPPMVLNQIALPAQEQGKLLVVLAEDWHTTETVAATSDLLYWQGLRNHALMLWNANNTFGFERINWGRLQVATRITAVSRYMKQKIWKYGVNALVLPNGIPERHLRAVPSAAVQRFESIVSERLLLTKFARFDPDKNWLPAVQAVARLRTLQQRPLFFMRGGIEAHGIEVVNEIKNLGLRQKELVLNRPSLNECLDAIAAIQEEAEIILLRFFVPEEMQRVLYRACDAVLANSAHEPFGLVGLEVMAAQGIAFVGATGEDYAQHLTNAISLDTSDPNEIVGNLLYLQHHPHVVDDLRRAGQMTANFYTWPHVIQKIISKLQYLLMAGGTTWPG
ncbi:MAG: glycosyltransferase family 4 protein [Ardenticatenaceae bacterium]